MSQGLLQGAHIFRLPSNAEARLSDRAHLYRTRAFPAWSLCLGEGHQGPFGILYQGNQCPDCRRLGRRRQESIRFVRACNQGHLDDVHWPQVVHRNAGCNHTDWFRWHGGGGALSQVNVECPICGQRANLGQAYGQTWSCSGRYPEREPFGTPPVRPWNCPQRARIIQRQASNLRIPELRTLFTIPPRATRLHNLLQTRPVLHALTAIGLNSLTSIDVLRNTLNNLAAQRYISPALVHEILQHRWEEIHQAITEVLRPVSTDFHELLREEFRQLLEASRNGYPPIRPAPSSPAIFEVNPASVRVVPFEHGRRIRVTPVSRLQTVTVQIGYRREVGGGAQAAIPAVTQVSFQDVQNRIWFPGVRFLGEGLFLSLENDNGWHFPLQSMAAQNWTSATGRGATYPNHLFRAPGHPDELNPVFIWWHTFAHLLIRAISIDSGYSSAAIRERVYFELEQTPRRTRTRGGVILYATQPGNDGSLGGLIALVPHFERIFARALEMLRVCSNDPLCAENHFTTGRYCGPACYSCLLISETSCEHRNLWLDREILLD